MRTYLLFTLFFVSGCSTIASLFDDVSLVWNKNIDIESVETPQGFVVSPIEIYGLVERPIKFSWELYSDRRNYYLSPLNSLVPFESNNSKLAKNYDLKICGISRKQFDEIREQLREKGTRTISSLKSIGNYGC